MIFGRSKAVLWWALVFLVPTGAFGEESTVEWNNALLDSIRAENIPPCLAARNLAIVHGAIYDASLAATGKDEGFLFRASPQSGASAEAAMNSAAYAAACYVHPSREARFERIHRAVLARLGTGAEVEAGERLGRKVGQAWIDWRNNDGITKSLPYIPKPEPGAWKRTPPFFRPPDLPAWCLVEPFTMVGSAQFRPAGPPALTTERYAEDVNAVKVLGGVKSTDRTAEQTETARFWSDFSYSVTPPGHWNQIAQNVAERRGLSTLEQARLFAILNLAMADVGIACWEAKYYYNWWRPVTAIRAADTDGNPATEKDPQWSSLLTTPAFPEYVSGHSAFSGAGAVVLQTLVGTDSFEFSVLSDTLPGRTRSFGSFNACAQEISQSRLYGGIHFPSALRDGLVLGQKIAGHVLARFTSANPNLKMVFTAPVEMAKGYWVGGVASPGHRAALERYHEGEWQVWTNQPAAGPMVRWKVTERPSPDSLRIVLQ